MYLARELFFFLSYQRKLEQVFWAGHSKQGVEGFFIWAFVVNSYEREAWLYSLSVKGGVTKTAVGT